MANGCLPSSPRTFLVALACANLSACGLDRAELTEMHAVGGDAFEYRADTTLFLGPRPDGIAERLRLDWLATRLAIEGRCAEGYALLSREFVPRYDDAYGSPAGAVVYRGRCAPADATSDDGAAR
jgi:hypothetical protein